MASGDRRRTRSSDEDLSRLLAKVLRHNAVKLGLPIQSDGFVFVNELLEHSEFRGYCEQDIKRIVNLCEKQRFTLINDPRTKKLKIKANKGRTTGASDMDVENLRSAYAKMGLQESDSDKTLSRSLARVLRHDAVKLDLPIQSDGFIFVSDLLKCSKFSGYCEEDIKRVVNLYENRRFTLETDPRMKKLKIKANQGHTIPLSSLELQEIKTAQEIPVLIHLTTEEAWRNIKDQGLKRMKREHIHFSPGEDSVVRSKLRSCKVHIYIDTAKAIAGGIKFLRSANDVILSYGDASGTLPTKFFSKVELHEGSRRSRLM